MPSGNFIQEQQQEKQQVFCAKCLKQQEGLQEIHLSNNRILCHKCFNFQEHEEEQQQEKQQVFRKQTKIGECEGCKMVCEECENLMIVEDEEEEEEKQQVFGCDKDCGKDATFQDMYGNNYCSVDCKYYEEEEEDEDEDEDVEDEDGHEETGFTYEDKVTYLNNHINRLKREVELLKEKKEEKEKEEKDKDITMVDLYKKRRFVPASVNKDKERQLYIIKRYLNTNKSLEKQPSDIQKVIEHYITFYHEKHNIYKKNSKLQFLANYDSSAIEFKTKQEHRQFIKEEIINLIEDDVCYFYDEY